MLDKPERRRPTTWQSLNNFIPIVLLAFTSWIAVSVVEGKTDRARINASLLGIRTEIVSVKDEIRVNREYLVERINIHDRDTMEHSLSNGKVHHQSEIPRCDGCHIK